MNTHYTVTEYARLLGKDPGNIRRMLINGKIPGEKLGNQWVIPKGVEYPEDGRVSSGKYKNWRRKNHFSQTHPDLMKSLNKMCSNIHDIYGDSLEKIVLYGSYARGEETAESDVDIAIFLKTPDTEKEHDHVVDIVVDYELDLGVTLSCIPIETSQYHQWRVTLPFYQNIDKEGIILWPAA